MLLLPNGCWRFIEYFCSSCFWRLSRSPCSWFCAAATITNFLVVSSCNPTFIFCAFSFYFIFMWYLAYLQSCFTVSPFYVDWIPDSTFFHFIVCVVQKDQSRQTKFPGWPLLASSFGLLMVLKCLVLPKLCRSVKESLSVSKRSKPS